VLPKRRCTWARAHAKKSSEARSSRVVKGATAGRGAGVEEAGGHDHRATDPGQRFAGPAGAGVAPLWEAPIKPTQWAEDEEHLREDEGLKTRTPEQRQSWWRRLFGG
jgi:hypothetical protein